MTRPRARGRICWVLLGVLGCGGRNSAEDADTDAAAGGADDATSTAAPYAGTWDAGRSLCPNGIYTELRDATWSLELTDSSYTETFSAVGCQATNSMIALAVQADHIDVDLSSGSQSCDPDPCQGNYSSTDTGSPAGVSYAILLCPKQIAQGRTATLTFAGDDMSYSFPGESCVQHFTRRQ